VGRRQTCRVSAYGPHYVRVANNRLKGRRLDSDCRTATETLSMFAEIRLSILAEAAGISMISSHERRRWKRDVTRAVIAVVVVATASALGQIATYPNLSPWYASLIKPSFDPPNWVFAPVWTTLYALMAFALWRILRLSPSSTERVTALGLFLLQRALNAAWSWMFFWAHSSYHRVRCAPSAPSVAVLRELLQQNPNASFPEQGCASQAICPSCRPHRSETSSRRPAPSIYPDLISDRHRRWLR